MTHIRLIPLAIMFVVFSACHETAHQPAGFNQTDTDKSITTPSVSSAAGQADRNTNDSIFEKKVLDTILRVKEVQDRAKYIEYQTKGSRHISVWVEDTPHLPEQDYFWIKAGEDNGTNLVTHFNFYVYPSSMKIMYYDIASDSILTLDDWRRTSGL